MIYLLRLVTLGEVVIVLDGGVCNVLDGGCSVDIREIGVGEIIGVAVGPVGELNGTGLDLLNVGP